MPEITITNNGVVKLLKNFYASKPTGPDEISARLLNEFGSVLRERPFNLKGGGGGYVFFLKKYSDSQCC